MTPTLFSRWPTAEALAGADREEMEAVLRPTGFFRAKTNSVIDAQRRDRRAVRRRGAGPARGPRHAARVSGARPRTSCWATRSACPGITVDTHFGRLVRRFGWTAETDPVKVEHAVGALFPKRDWTMLSHVLIFHGRRTCHARKPACGACPVAQWCPAYGEGETDPVKARKLLAYELAPGRAVLPDPPPGPLPDDPIPRSTAP